MVDLLSLLLPALLALAVVAYVLLRKKSKSFFRRRVVAVTVIAVAGPLVGLLPINSGEISDVVGNTDILFVVDLTYSMNAEDGNRLAGGEPVYRLEQAINDITDITTQLTGSRFAIIAYDNVVARYLPFTKSNRDASIAASTLSTKAFYQANRSPDFTGALESAAAYLEKSQELDDTRRQMVVILTDGQLTGDSDDSESVLGATSRLKNQAVSTMVVGYGGASPEPVPVVRYDYQTLERIVDDYNVPDPDNYSDDAMTERDDEFLGELASVAGGVYFVANDTDNLSAEIDKLRSDSASKPQISEASNALSQNILHAPLALLAIRWLYLTELSAQPFLRKLLSRGFKR